MAILGKLLIERKTKQLDQYYAELKAILEGSPIDKNLARFVVASKNDINTVTNVSIDRLTDCLGHIKVAIDSLGRLKADEIKPSQNPRYFEDNEDPSQY